MINGTIWKERDVNVSISPIAKNKTKKIIEIDASKIHRPYIIFLTNNDKVLFSNKKC